MTLVEILLVIIIAEKTAEAFYWKIRVEPKMDAVLATAKLAKVESRLANTLAGSVLKDSRQLNEDTKQVVQEGVRAAAIVTAETLASSLPYVPPSGDKMPRPSLPEPA